MLCIDVSGSMDGTPILEAVRGARDVRRDAVAARYKVGVMLWNTMSSPSPNRRRRRRGDADTEAGDRPGGNT